MNLHETTKRRIGKGAPALAALAVAAVAAAPASAAVGQGSATLTLSQQAKGKSLNAQGVKVAALAPATKSGKTFTLPVWNVDVGTDPGADTRGGLKLTANGKTVKLTALRLGLGGATLTGKLGGKALTIFRFDGTPAVNAVTGAASLPDSKLTLTGAAAKTLREKLGLESLPAKWGAGHTTLEAKADPIREAAKAVVSGSTGWGVLATWRKYILGNFGPGSVGTITTADGAGSTGVLSETASFFSFPAASGSLEKGLYGAGDKLALKTSGSVKFAKPGHCIVEVRLSGLEVTIDGPNSSIALDSIYDIDTPAGMTCTDVPAVPTTDVNFAALDVSAVTPMWSADGKTVTWAAIPAKLTAAGAKAFGAGYAEGQVLDPVTITVGVG